jgi:hypothetical protein
MVAINANGQFAIINNKNGYVDVRKEKSPESKIVGRLFNDDVFLYDVFSVSTWPNDEWVTIFQDVFMDKIEPYKRDYYIKEFGRLENDHFICDGDIRKIEFTPLKDLEEIKLQRTYLIDKESSLKNDSIYFANDSIKLLFVYGRFNPTEHKIEKHSDQRGQEYIDEIDGHPPIRGIFGNMPTTDIKKINLTIKSDSIEIPKLDYWDLFNPNIWKLSLRVDKKGVIYIYLFDNSDGAGWYAAVWMIKGHKYLKRYVDSM